MTASVRLLHPPPVWHDLLMPQEHGSWSLAFEPLALGLLVAPSVAGALLAIAVAAAFFMRRPLRIAWGDASPERRAAARGALLACAAVATVFSLGAVALAGFAWAPWLLPSAAAGAIFVAFDLRHGGREEVAEIAGSAAFAFLPAALATAAAWPAPAALALGFVMLGRTVPTVLCVRAYLRGARTGAARPALALAAALLALVGAMILAVFDLAPITAAVLLGALALRSGGLLVFPRPALRAPALGLVEAVAGAIFVSCAAAAWRF
jgi:hypothetical protein